MRSSRGLPRRPSRGSRRPESPSRRRRARSLTASAGREGAEAKLPEAKADVEAAGADLRAAEAGLLKAELLVQQATIASPLDGIVTRRNFQPGDFVRSGDQAGARPLVSIVNAGKVRVVVAIANADVPFLAPGAPATVRLDSAGERSYKGTIARTAYALDPTTATLRAEIDFDNADGRLRPGQTATVVIDLEGHTRHLSIPRSAVITVGPGSAEILRIEGGRAVRTQISVVSLSGAEPRVEVTKGLKEGDRVVVRPEPNRMEDQPVEAEEVGAAVDPTPSRFVAPIGSPPSSPRLFETGRGWRVRRDVR